MTVCNCQPPGTHPTTPGCTGSLGDAIVDIDFGTAQDIGNPLPPGTTNMGFYPYDCPGDGNYTIIRHSQGCYNDGWHTISDHTGNADGCFMLINASFEPSDFFVQMVSGLCQGTTYQFGAWVINMDKYGGGILPNVSFTIELPDGTILASYTTGDIPASINATWAPYTFNFTTPANVQTVILRMHNNAPGGQGNDLALDDITFRPIGPTISVGITGANADTINICQRSTPNPNLYGAVASCYLSTAYHWQVSRNNGGSWTDIANADSLNYTPSTDSAGVYLYRLLAAQANDIGISTCRVNSVPLTVVISPGPFPGKDTAVYSCPGYPVNLYNLYDTAGYRYSAWDLNDPQDAGEGFFTFTVKNTNGCSYSSHVTVKLLTKPDPGRDIDTSVCENNVINLTGLYNTVSFAGATWSTANPTQAGPGAYNLFVTGADGCQDTATVVVVGKKPDTSYIVAAVCGGQSFLGHSSAGNYTDILSDSAASGCDSIRNLNLTVNPVFNINIDTTACYNQSVLGYSAAGTYNIHYLTVNGCDSAVQLTLHIIPLPQPNLGRDITICPGESVTLYPGKFEQYLWQDGSTDSHFVVTQAGIYSVSVSNSCGTATSSTHVSEAPCALLFPTAFTPNGDGKNDIFKLLNPYNIASFKLVVYNRWGQKMFSTNNPLAGWDGITDGEPQVPGPYVWYCIFKKNGDKAESEQKGTVVLIR
ncbi:MAG TPA: gliding motility-associated C-terminal domain-containing protein [Chitinophagaceae bacterium]|nr:gliding motility-associated C-terminal domain-containing protein [Chitinophagaceae bacterium]